MKLFLLLFVFSSIAHAQELRPHLQSCGVYQIVGDLKKDPKTMMNMVIHEKSKSQIVLSFASGELIKAVNYVGEHVAIDGTISKFNGSSGLISKISKITTKFPDPLHPDLYGGFILKEKMECKND